MYHLPCFPFSDTFIEHLLSPWQYVWAEQHNRGVPKLFVDGKKGRYGGRKSRTVSGQGLGFLKGRRFFFLSSLLI